MSTPEAEHQKPITIHDVAKLAEVSVATVSRVLNGYTTVDPLLADRVRIAAASLKYQPSKAARILAGSRSSLLGLLVTDIQNPFYMDLIRGVEEVARQHGYLLVICNTSEDSRQEEQYIQVLAAEAVAGAIIVPTQGRLPSLDLLKARRIPVVAVDRRVNDRFIDAVLIDNVAAAREAVAHLITNGYRRIGMVTGPRAATNTNERAQGYYQALQEAGIAFDPALEQRGSLMSSDTGEVLTNTLLDLDPPVDAIFTTNNRLSTGALRVLYARNKRIPEDVALVCFDEIHWPVPNLVSITTVMQSAYELGCTAASRLMQRLQKPDAPKQEIILQYQLMICASSGPRTTSNGTNSPFGKEDERKGDPSMSDDSKAPHL
jgi:LacI family transcriptional regulator